MSKEQRAMQLIRDLADSTSSIYVKGTVPDSDERIYRTAYEALNAAHTRAAAVLDEADGSPLTAAVQELRDVNAEARQVNGRRRDCMDIGCMATYPHNPH